MKLLIFALMVVLSLNLTLGQRQQNPCPPAEVLSPCLCETTELDSSIYCDGIQEEINLKGIFDNASRYVEEDFVFYRLGISFNPYLVEIGEGAIEQLKFEEIWIYQNPNLEYISPRAFNATKDRTNYLSLFNNSISNSGARERDIFDAVSGFKKIWTLDLHSNRISSIPENAFQNLSSLVALFVTSNPISHVGSRAFALGSSSPTVYLSLDDNLISSGDIAEDAFNGFRNERQDIHFNLFCNKIEYLEQMSFKTLLDQAERVFIGSYEICEGDTELQTFGCDERVAWICNNKDNYRSKLVGYRCRNGTGFGNIWDYCAGRNNTGINLS